MSEKKIKLSVLGFSFNQSKSGTYGLVLAEDKGLRRLMIVVGTPEAQSIAFKLHNTEPPRPLTHDLFEALLSKLDIGLKEVVIYKYEDGVFFAQLVFISADNTLITIESRTSDAIAIALRTNSPMYTTQSIMEELAVVFDQSEKSRQTAITPSNSKFSKEETGKHSYSIFSKKELEALLQEALVAEDYELASVIRDEIKKKDESKN